MRLLKWATFLVLILIVVGVAISYPTWRNRFIAPALAGPYPSLETVANVASATLVPTNTVPINTVPATPRPTLSLAATSASTALVIIASTATSTPQPSQADATDAPTEQSGKLATPPTIATTSLLPASFAAERITPVVLASSVGGVNSGSITPTVTITATVAASVTPRVTDEIAATSSTASPTTPAASVPHPEKGGDPQGWAPATSTATATVITPTTDGTVTPTTTPDITVSVITTTTITSTQVISTQVITTSPTITIVATVTPMVITPMPAGPFANANSPLYGGPDLTSPVVGQTTLGESLTIIGRYTEGTWYLLASGVWIPGEVVDNAPLALPLVFPTPTPVPSATPTITPTPLPTATPQTSATPTPTPTSLGDAVCDCSSDNRDCLGNIFANRAEAQLCFEYCFRQTGLDIHLLDPNLNGLACENLP